MSESATTRSATERTVTTTVGRIYVTEVPGEDPALILLHGFPDDSRVYDHPRPLLSPDDRNRSNVDVVRVTCDSDRDEFPAIASSYMRDPTGGDRSPIQSGPALPCRRGVPMLSMSRTATRLPAADLERARSYYADQLNLEPSEERPGGLLYRCAGTEFALFQSAGAPSGTHTQMAWEVDDLEATVAELRARGVVFEEFNLPGLTTVNGITTVKGNYPSKGGKGEKAAWFRDSEGNLLGIGQPV
jgi:catechol 2,3-dioxygenase-like lactoylglutathione lyase family enzyme